MSGDDGKRRETTKRVNELMARLSKLSRLGDETHPEKQDEMAQIRAEILSALRTAVDPDDPSLYPSRDYGFADGGDVTLSKVGESSAQSKKFGKRTWEGGIPPPSLPLAEKYRFSKRMATEGKTEGERSARKDDDVAKQADIFAPRNANLRNGLLSVETKGSRFPPVSSPRKLTGILPLAEGYGDPSAIAERVYVNSKPSPRDFTNGKFPVPTAHSIISHVREVLRHDGKVFEKSPRQLPSKEQRHTRGVPTTMYRTVASYN